MDIKKLEPYGTGNEAPIFLLKDLKIIKSTILNHCHISTIFKSKSGFSIRAISFNSAKNKIGEYLLNYKKNLNVLGQIKENYWNNLFDVSNDAKDSSKRKFKWIKKYQNLGDGIYKSEMNEK